MINKLIEINKKLIITYNDNSQELEKQLLIKKILNTKNCFSKMNVTSAYAILRDLTIPEDNLKEVYKKLIIESEI